MNCKEARALAIECSRDAGAADLHFETCARCARFLDTQRAMGAQLAAVARETPDAPDLESKLLAEFRAASTGRRRGFGRWVWAGGALASVVVGALVLRNPAPARRASGEPFIEIPYTAPLAPYERSRVVRMDIPVAALIAAGFEVHAPDTGAVLQADVLFGQDGRAHAIRLVSRSIPISN